MSSPDVPEVALVAVASNEAAYLPEWVFHHLHFGFDRIEIHVNRSTDNSFDIGREIAREHDRVHVIEADPVGQTRAGRKDIQLAIYKNARRRLKSAQRRDAYVMYLDIDEFWIPRDFSTPVGQYLAGAGFPKVASFNWFTLLNDEEIFARAVKPASVGLHTPHVKSASQLALPVHRMNPHSVRSMLPVKRHSASDLPLVARSGHKTVSCPKLFGHAFVLHRLYRSRLEYLAVLGRPLPNHPDEPFKRNRSGYRHSGNDQALQDRFAPDQIRLLSYEHGMKEFFSNNNLSELVKAAQYNVLLRAKKTLDRFLTLPQSEHARWERAFSNLELESVAADLLGQLENWS